MSLVQEYSSDEDNESLSLSNDVFGLSHLPASKKARLQEAQSPCTPEAAPQVLAEVGHFKRPAICIQLTYGGS
jgi:pre-mRNA-processing factor 17